METPLLQTKLYIPPTRPKLVSRPRLIERLNEVLPRQSASLSEGRFARKLTLISAPAGFGKTTLVSEWAQAMGRVSPPIAVAWLSLDEGDNDPTRFLTYFIAALQTLALSADGTSEAEGIEARQEPAAQQEPVDVIGKGALGMLQSPQPPPNFSTR
jgi:LuxR family maltose regulon positive regulatory protein